MPQAKGSVGSYSINLISAHDLGITTLQALIGSYRFLEIRCLVEGCPAQKIQEAKPWLVIEMET
jgi:hypothetical protein